MPHFSATATPPRIVVHRYWPDMAHYAGDDLPVAHAPAKCTPSGAVSMIVRPASSQHSLPPRCFLYHHQLRRVKMCDKETKTSHALIVWTKSQANACVVLSFPGHGRYPEIVYNKSHPAPQNYHRTISSFSLLPSLSSNTSCAGRFLHSPVFTRPPLLVILYFLTTPINMRYSLAFVAALTATVQAHGVITEVQGANGVNMPGLSGTHTNTLSHLSI